eukprot:gene1786-33206_t
MSFEAADRPSIKQVMNALEQMQPYGDKPRKLVSLESFAATLPMGTSHVKRCLLKRLLLRCDRREKSLELMRTYGGQKARKEVSLEAVAATL